MTGLARLLNPGRIAVIGGGAWCAAIMEAAERIGFDGELIPVHPSKPEIAGLPARARLEDIDGTIDAAFIGINRHATIEAVRVLRELGAGGAVCFASGFTEAAAEDSSGAGLQRALVEAAGDMPILGPNCYGFVNALDGAAIWPDQHGMARVDRGVAILGQSSNIAINFTMQRRQLPLAMVVACGNMAQQSQARIAASLLDDDRITAIGCHIEGFGDVREWETLAARAHAKGVPLVALKVGRSEQAQAATVSHTASLAGSDAGAQALLDRLGIARTDDVPSFIEALKLLHVCGPLPSTEIASISCSGGEASLIADMAVGRKVSFPALTDDQKPRLRDALGPMVALANPLDYHTYIWRDVDAMSCTWSAMARGPASATISIVDYPVTDRRDWECATEAALRVRRETGRPMIVASTLPELMPADVAQTLIDGGVVPIAGLSEALSAVEAAAAIRPPASEPLALAGPLEPGAVLSEAEAKAALRSSGVPVPAGAVALVVEAKEAAAGLTAPFAVKGQGLAHKSEAGAVKLGICHDALPQAVHDVGTETVLIEEMVIGGVAELLVGVTRDPAHGFVLTVGAGGVLTELLGDTASLLVPADRAAVESALRSLRCWPLLEGFRGKPAANLNAVLDAIGAVQAHVLAETDTLMEMEINPLICTPETAVAADALIRKGQT